MPTQLKAPSFQESHLHAPSRAGAPALTITATTCPSRLLRASCRELKRLSSLRSRPNLGLRCGPNLWRAYNAGPCCPKIVPAYFVKTQASSGEVVGKCFCTQSACKIYGRRVITMPSFRIYPQAFLGRMFWDLPIKASCVS